MSNPVGELGRRQVPDVLAVQPIKFFQVEDRSAPGDAVQIERRDHFLDAEHLPLVRHGPADQAKVVQERFWQIADIAKVVQADGMPALGQLAPVLVAQQGQVGVLGHVPAEISIKQLVLRHRTDPVVAAQDMGDAHQVVVDNHGEVIGRESVAFQQDLHVDLGPRNLYRAAQPVLETANAAGRHAQAHDVRLSRLHPGSGDGGIQTGAETIVARRLAAFALRASQRIQAIGPAKAVESLVLVDEPPNVGAIDLPALALPVGTAGSFTVRPFVPLDTGPSQRVDDHGLRRGVRSFPVGIFYAQDELTALLAGEYPVEERHISGADMRIAGGRRRNARANSHQEYGQRNRATLYGNAPSPGRTDNATRRAGIRR